jgi:hypothetical protein
MKRFPLSAALIVCMIALPTAAFAGPLQQRLDRQEHRIYDGVEEGSLSFREYQKLEHRQDKIQAQRAQDIQDGGGLTPFEAFKLNWQLNRQSQRIYQQKHD